MTAPELDYDSFAVAIRREIRRLGVSVVKSVFAICKYRNHHLVPPEHRRALLRTLEELPSRPPVGREP